MTYDGQNYYFYDAEGRVCAVQPTYSIMGGSSAFGYLYDASGTRVAKGSVTPSADPATTPISCDPAVNGFQFTDNYVLGPSGEELTQIDGSSTWQRTNVYAAGRLLATYDFPNGQSALHFHLTDPLGTRRMQLSGMLGNLGQPEIDCQSLPFGDQLSCYPDPNAPANSSANDSNHLYFTGKERDWESGNDYFGARYFASSMGRFLSPDPSQLYYADPTNPQSFNLYSYVTNNPLMKIDPTGLDWCVNDNGNGTANVTIATDGGGVDCPGNGSYVETTATSASSVGFDSNGNLSTWSGAYSDGSIAFGVTAFDNSSDGQDISDYSISGVYLTSDGSGGSGGAPNSGPTPSHCTGAALKKNAVALALDAAGVGAGFLPGGDLVVAGAQITVAAGSTVNSAMSGDVTGSTTSIFDLQLAAMAPAAKWAGVGAKAVPFLGAVVSAGGGLNDALHTFHDYQSCMAGHP